MPLELAFRDTVAELGMNPHVEQLGNIELFAGLKQEALELIAKVATEEIHSKNEKIFRHGEVGDKLYLILNGKIRISREVPGMGEEALAVLGPGQAFGEMALLDESPRSADAVVHERCRLLTLSKDGFFPGSSCTQLAQRVCRGRAGHEERPVSCVRD